jgi:hypothetical protein
MRFSFEPVNGKPGFCKRISDTAKPTGVTIGGGVFPVRDAANFF